MDKEFIKTYSFKFTKEQIQQILTYYLLASGETVPQPVYDSGGYEEHDPDISMCCQTTDEETIDRFDLIFAFDETDVEAFNEAYSKDGSSLSNNVETKDELPDNVWTQASSLPCGKSECPINDDKE
jgi:hypothetical protein